MRFGHATRVLLIVTMIAAWGCRSEPDGPAPGRRPAAGSSDSRPAAASPAPNAAPGQPVARSEQEAKLEKALAEVRAIREGKALPLPPPFRVKAISTGDPELDPLVSFLRADFARSLQAGKKLVIEDHFDPHLFHLGESYQEAIGSLLKEASDQAPSEMIRDFGEKNRQTRAVWPELSHHLPAHLLSREERRMLFSAAGKAGTYKATASMLRSREESRTASSPDGDMDDGWNRFYEKYPGSPGIITISRVGLNREKDRALFYMGWMRGSLVGHGQLHVLKKEGDEWVEQPVLIGWSWES